MKSTNKMKRLEESAGSNTSRPPFSYHGEAAGGSAPLARFRSPRLHEEGPPSLPARAEDRRLDRSNSLSSLSNDSFGSTDKEVFERCVRMGMSKPQPERKEDKARVRGDDRLELREHRRRRREGKGALDKMVGEDSKDRAILEEVIARGAGEHKQSKNVPEPPAEAAAAGALARTAPPDTGSDVISDVTELTVHLTEPSDIFHRPNELPTVDSLNTTLESNDEIEMERSNECLAPKSVNTTIESEKDELNRSNESYADVFDGSWSDVGSPPKNYDVGTLTRKSTKLGWTDIKYTGRPPEDLSKKEDTWNDNTCPDDVTFPTISGSVHMVSSIRSEVVDPGLALPDLLEKSEAPSMSFSRPDLTNKLESDILAQNLQIIESTDRIMLDSIPEPSFTSLIDDQKFDSILTEEIEKEAARLAAQLKNSQYNMETSVTSLTSLDLDNVKPPSNLGSLLSLSASGQWDEASQVSKKSQKSRKKSLPVSLMVKRALSNSMHQGSSEHLESSPVSFLDNVKPPSEMEHLDMESSMISVSSIVSEVAEVRDKIPVVFDFKQPIQDFPLCTTFTHVFHDLDKVNPPSLFDEMVESTLEIEQTTAQQVDDCLSTLNVVTEIPSGSENCTPLPSDISSVESTPKKQRDPNYLTPKEKRHVSKDRYQTYTITDTVTENDVVLEVDEEFLTWTKSDSGRSEEYVTAISEVKSRRKMSAKQRRLEDRARYQTQTVNIHTIVPQQGDSRPDPSIESLKQRLAAKKTMKQKRLEDAERFRTRTLSEDIPPSPTFVTKDANFENVETTTGYDSLSSNELNHQVLDALMSDERQEDDVFSRDIDSGHNEDDFELNSTQMQTYTKSFRNYLPVIESPAAVDMCVVNNLKNIEMTASYRRALQTEKNQNPSSSDFGYEGDSNSEDKPHSESDTESPRPKPKIIKPTRRDESLDSNESLDKEPEGPKAIRGRKKAMYVSPYRRSAPAPKKTTAPGTKPVPKSANAPKPSTSYKAQTSAKSLTKTPSSANTSPKKSLPNRSPTKIAQQKPISIPPVATKPLPLERQGTFTKEESSVPARDLPVPDKKTTTPRLTKSAPQTKANTSPSRLPQFNRYSRPPTTKAPNKSPTKVARKPETSMRNSPSNHSLQSNESGKTITIASRSSRQGSTSSVNSIQSTSKASAKDIESKISSLWKKVEQAKKQPPKADKRVWIEGDETKPPRLIRSSTFEGQPKALVSAAAKQKSAIGIRVSQIPSLRPKSIPNKPTQAPAKKPTSARVFTRKPAGGQAPT